MITNTPEKYVASYEVDPLRDTCENRARWFYYLVREGLEQGLPIEFARDAMREAAKSDCKQYYEGKCTLEAFVGEYFDYMREKAFEGTIEEQDEEKAVISFGYSPYIAAWLKLTEDEAFIAQLLDVSFDYDRGLAECCGLKLEVEDALAEG
ncbi:MAG: hypothetical protein IJH87_04975, partial [Atopobiaceae bacterium]|nr:hypothetical protein [Atopobiaceae bacterium]